MTRAGQVPFQEKQFYSCACYPSGVRHQGSRYCFMATVVGKRDGVWLGGERYDETGVATGVYISYRYRSLLFSACKRVMPELDMMQSSSEKKSITYVQRNAKKIICRVLWVRSRGRCSCLQCERWVRRSWDWARCAVDFEERKEDFNEQARHKHGFVLLHLKCEHWKFGRGAWCRLCSQSE